MVVPRSRSSSVRFICALSLSALVLLAAVWSAASGPAEAQDGTAAARARAYLSQNAAGMGLRADLGDLRVAGGRSSLTADHVRYQQTLNGVPVFGATVSVSLPKKGDAPAWVLNRYAAGARAAKITAPAPPGPAAAKAVAGIGAASAQEVAPAELVYYPAADRTFRLAWKLTLRTQQPLGTWLVIADAETGDQLLRLDLLRYDQGQVFDPNPAVTNGGTAPAPDCDSVGNHVLLSGQYRTRTLQGIDAGQGKLKGEFVDMTAPGIDTDLDGDGTPNDYKPAGQANEASHNYNYGCMDDRFEEVMVYYHIDKTQRTMQALGFSGPTGIIDNPIPAHAHYFPGCNAFYDPSDLGLHFGDSDDFLDCFGLPSTDFAEDADVIVHEYGHAIQDNQVPGWGIAIPPYSEQPRAIGEGFGDFMAGVISGDPCLGEYGNFGMTECGGSPGLRWMQNSKSYPADFEACRYDSDGDTVPDRVEEHCAGEIWGGALWDLVEGLSGGGGAVTQAGRDLALKLVLESQFYLDQISSFNEAAAAVCYADQLLYSGSHQSVIGGAFVGHGIDTGACLPSDFPSLYMRISHPSSGDLDVNFVVGSNVNAPLCEVNVGDPISILNGFPDFYVFAGELDAASCSNFLPPSPSQPWWLEVRDAGPLDVGTIDGFQIGLPGGVRCVATDTPVNIPDNGPAVYSKVDCTNQVGPGAGTPGPQTPTPTPGAGGLAGDVDCSGGVNSVDSLKILRYVASLSVAQNEPCTNIGDGIAGFASQAHGGPHFQGDVDCGGGVDAVDSLKVLRYVASLPNNLPEGCPAIGSPTGGGATPTPTPTPTSAGTPTPTLNPSLTDCPTFGSQISIPDNSTTGIKGTIDVTQFGTLQDLDVCVNVIHPRPNDLRITLKRVGTNTSVVLFNGTSCALPNVYVYFDDEAGNTTICPHDGTERPANPLSGFDGGQIHGKWEMTFADVAAGQTGKALGVIIWYEYVTN